MPLLGRGDGKPNRAGYGFGWFIESQKGHRVVEHEGRWQGFSAQMSRYLDDGITVVILVNQGNCDPHLIADEVAAVYLKTGTLSKLRLGFPLGFLPSALAVGQRVTDLPALQIPFDVCVQWAALSCSAQAQ